MLERTSAFSCSVMCSMVKSFTTEKVQEHSKCECLLHHCPQSVSKPLQDCCHASKCKQAHFTGQATSHDFLHVNLGSEQRLF